MFQYVWYISYGLNFNSFILSRVIRAFMLVCLFHFLLLRTFMCFVLFGSCMYISCNSGLKVKVCGIC